MGIFLANAGYGNQTSGKYIVDPNVYGKYTDPYLHDTPNPHMVDFTTDGKTVGFEESVRKPNPITYTLDFSRSGLHLDFNNVSVIHDVNFDVPSGANCNNKDSSTPAAPNPESGDVGTHDKVTQAPVPQVEPTPTSKPIDNGKF